MASDVTQLLRDWHGGDSGARERLWPVVYGELRRLAQYHMNDQQAGHTLQATALVNEAFIKLVDTDYAAASKGVFFALAARAMRSILVDHARARNSAKRGGDRARVTLAEEIAPSGGGAGALLDIDRALKELARNDPRKGDIVELRIFGGMTFDEIANTLGLSNATVRADWRFARAWLEARLEASVDDGA
jgi:RNA polymerase sigma factor (TIGR02999 family)